MSLKVTLNAIVFLLTAYFPAAIFLALSFEDPRPPGRIVAQLIVPFVPLGGHAYRADPLPGDMERLQSFAADAAVEGSHTGIKVYEDQHEFREGANFREVSTVSGRYAFWANPGIVISTSDNSDPNKNRRTYWAVVP